MMELRSCSRCIYWGEYKGSVENIVVAECDKTIVQNAKLGLSRLVVKGSDVCGQWKKEKFKMIMTLMGWTKVRDYD